MWKLAAGVAMLLVMAIATKTFLLPVLTGLSITEIRNMPVSDILKLFEATIITVIVAGFILQELLRAVPELLRRDHGGEASGARWGDLVYVFVAAFGSAALYIAIGRFAGW